MEEILRARAKALAKEAASTETAADETVEVLDFTLSNEAYAFELADVCEIAALDELCPLPGVPVHVMGITCRHGRIIAVVDLRKILGLPDHGLRDSRHVIVLQSEEMEFGILGERVTGVRRLSLPGCNRPCRR